jgi:hypothetical protein
MPKITPSAGQSDYGAAAFGAIASAAVHRAAERQLCFRHFAEPASGTEVRWSAFSLRDEAGDLIGAAAFTTDTSARKEAERALREQEMPLASVLKNLPLGVGVRNRRGDLVHSTRVCASMTTSYGCRPAKGLLATPAGATMHHYSRSRPSVIHVHERCGMTPFVRE